LIKRTISLSILTILLLSALSVASASTSKTTTADYEIYARSVTAQQPTTLTFTAPAQVKLDQFYAISGSLTTANGTGINDAQLLYQQLQDNKWVSFGAVYTDLNGTFTDKWIETDSLSKPGTSYYRVIYNGDSQYAPAVSNEVAVIISKY